MSGPSHEILRSASLTVPKSRMSKYRVHPKHQSFAKWYERYMILIALLGSIFVYLQAGVIIKNKSSENVSMPSYIIYLIVSLSWMAYGILWTDWVHTFSGLIASIGAIIALISTASYRPTKNPGPFTTVL